MERGAKWVDSVRRRRIGPGTPEATDGRWPTFGSVRPPRRCAARTIQTGKSTHRTPPTLGTVLPPRGCLLDTLDTGGRHGHRPTRPGTTVPRPHGPATPTEIDGSGASASLPPWQPTAGRPGPRGSGPAPVPWPTRRLPHTRRIRPGPSGTAAACRRVGVRPPICPLGDEQDRRARGAQHLVSQRPVSSGHPGRCPFGRRGHPQGHPVGIQPVVRKSVHRNDGVPLHRVAIVCGCLSGNGNGHSAMPTQAWAWHPPRSAPLTFRDPRCHVWVSDSLEGGQGGCLERR